MDSAANPWWLQVVLVATPPFLAAIVAGFLAYKNGVMKSKLDSNIAKEHLRYQKSLEEEKLLQNERGKKIELWRDEIAKCTALNPDTGATRFDYHNFVRTGSYLSLRSHLSKNMQSALEINLQTQAQITSNQAFDDYLLRQVLLEQIEELEEEWQLV